MEKIKPYQIILTWVSSSWKTTLMKELVKRWKAFRPIQFTTRPPRDDSELDDYVFLTKSQFVKKLENWDFMEYIFYNGEYYAISKYFDETKSNIFIVEPAWKAQIIKHFKLNNVRHISLYLELEYEEARRRLMDRGESIATIESRLEDFKYFCPEANDIVLDWSNSIQRNLSLVIKYSHL